MWPLPFGSAIVAAVLAFAAAWSAQEWRMQAKIDKVEAEYAKQIILSAQQAHEAQVQIDQNYQAAFHEAARRERALRLELERLHDVSDGLRQQSNDAAARLAKAAPAAAVEFAIAANAVFDECQRELANMAEKADGHAGDVQALSRAWPSFVPVE